MTRSGAGERGLTLTELMIVIALAGIVTLGLVSFYFNSQTIWIDGSTQAMTQREATHMVQVITDRTHEAAIAHVFDSPDTLHKGLQLIYPDGSNLYFWWDPVDSLIHRGPSFALDQGPIGDSKVMSLQLDCNESMVFLKRLELRSANGQRVFIGSSMALMNRVDP